MWLKIFLILIVILFICVLGIKRFVYFRPSYAFIQPKETFKDIYEGNLHAWYKKGLNDKVILFCHSNTGNISYCQDRAIDLLKLGYSVLLFDYSGYGNSRGVPNELLCYSNADMYYTYLLRNGYDKNSIVPYGEGLGCAVAAFIGRKYNLPKVILQSCFPGMKYYIKFKYPYLSYLSYIFDDFDTFSYVKGYVGKLLILHCVNDEVIPFDMVKKLFSNYNIIEMNGSHKYPVIDWNVVKQFLEDKSI